MNIEPLSLMTHDIKPTRERRRHGLVERSPDQVQDIDGNIGDPWIARGLLDGLQRRGAISTQQRLAGEEFHRHFQLAALDPIRAADMARIPISGLSMAHKGSVRARSIVHAALLVLGGISSPAGSCAWHVLGCEITVNDWSRREGWSGRPISPHVASGILIATLGILENHDFVP